MIITRRGYQIKKSKLLPFEIDELTEELNVVPKLAPPYNMDITPFKLIHFTKDNIFIPRYYGIAKYGDIFKSEIFNSKKINCEFNGVLRDNQLSIIDDIMNKLYKYHGGVITLPCAYGKTVLSLYIACQLKLKTIILVHKTDLLNQWLERINIFVNNASVGIIEGNKIQSDKDIIVGMIQSIALKDYEKIFSDIGLLIVDECHHIAAEKFSKCLYKIGADYTIGLSATPHRKDGLTKVIYWYLGNQLITIEDRKCEDAVAYDIQFNCDNPQYIVKTRRFRGKDTIDTVGMITTLSKIEERNNLIMEIIKKLLENKDRYIMVLSNRIEHLEKLKELTDKILDNETLSGLFVGKSSDELKKECTYNDKIHIIFASYSIASEGLDIPKLNTIILASPQKDIKQSIGRIMRKKHNINCNPLVIDIDDQINPFKKYINEKIRLYKKNNYHFKIFEENEFNINELSQDNILKNIYKNDDIKINNIDDEKEENIVFH